MLPINREFIAQFVIALAVCIGAWYFFVRPKMIELDTVQSALTHDQFGVSAPDNDPLLALADHAASLRARIEEVQQRNELARDTSNLYATVQALSDANHVEILQLQPGADTGKTDNNTLVTRKEIRISVVGTYANVASFLEEVGDVGGFLVPVSLTVSPIERDDRSLVQVNLTCNAMQFSVQSVLEKLNGASHGAS